MSRETFEYSGKKKYGKTTKVVSVTFPISRYEEYTFTIDFKEPVTIGKAIKKAEKFLSKPLTKKWWNKVKDDCFEDEPDFDVMCRGCLLGDLRYIEDIILETDENDKTLHRLSFDLGS